MTNTYFEAYECPVKMGATSEENIVKLLDGEY